MAADDIALDIQALAVECAATNQRAGVERHETLAMSRKWNADLIPSERRLAAELAAAAITMRRLATLIKARPDLLKMLEEHP